MELACTLDGGRMLKSESSSMLKGKHDGWVSSKPFGVCCCCCPSPTSCGTSVGDDVCVSRQMLVVLALAFVHDSADVGIQG